ncbi:hypothetical protein A7W90_16240 [Clostridium sp. Bc-iso-3]|nr:hypothetical protein A7W90_16240 [Clostridium sp. Bc-iso-3]
METWKKLIKETSGRIAAQGTVEFTAAGANTLKESTLLISNPKTSNRIEITNPSTESDLTVEVYDVIDAEEKFVSWFTIPKKATRSNGKQVQSHIRQLPPIASKTIKIAMSNDQQVTTGFTATVIIREI